MSWQAEEPVIKVLHEVANPIRMAAIKALTKGEMRFSQLLASCDLDYDHDTGYFYYHISELMDRSIVEKVGNGYRLTDFGQKIARILNSLEKECSLLFAESKKWIGRKADIGSLEGRWIEGDELEILEMENGSAGTGPHTEANSTQVIVSEESPDNPELRKLNRFQEEIKSWKGSVSLLVKEKDRAEPLGWATIRGKVSLKGKWSGITDKGENMLVFAPRASLIIEDIGILPVIENRKEVASNLLVTLLKRAEQMGADIIEVKRVDVEDAVTIEALGDMGFERVATSHVMRRKLSKGS